ncbi:MAG: glycosyltransferase family 2 protein [Minisyncoccia bacterium]
MSRSKPILSIVVLAWNNQQDLQNCIESISTTYKEYYQLIIIDNASTDKTSEYLDNLQQNWDKKHAKLKIITNTKNLGYAAGNNVALEYIEGKYTLWLNQDIVLQNNSILHLAQYLDNHSEYAMLAPQLQYPDGRIQKSCRKLPTLGHMFNSIFKLKWDDHFDYTQSQECEQPMASAIMIRSSVMQELGGFDTHPDYWLFFNDVDLSKNLQSRDYKTYYLAEAKIYHHHGASTKKLWNIKKRLYWQKGFNRYFIKWYYTNWAGKVFIYLLSSILFILLVLRDSINFIKK